MSYWRTATPLSWGIGMTKDENPIYGENRCLIIVDDAGHFWLEPDSSTYTEVIAVNNKAYKWTKKRFSNSPQKTKPTPSAGASGLSMKKRFLLLRGR